MKKVSLMFVLMTFFVGIFQCYASPYFLGSVHFTQPDGKNIVLEHIEDEFGSYYMTKKGAAVRDEAGFWCYARYDENNKFTPTTFRVGSKAEKSPELSDLRYQNSIKHTAFMNKVHGMNSISNFPKGVGKPAITSATLDVLLVCCSDTVGTYTRNDFMDLFFGDTYTLSPSPNRYTTYGSMKVIIAICP